MAPFGHIPPEPARLANINLLAPAVRRAVASVMLDVRLATGTEPVVFETLRTDVRQTWLYGFGRDYDDGRGEVTQLSAAAGGWHRYGLAADLIHPTRTWDAPHAWWDALGHSARRYGLAWGGDWPMRDMPHVQWGRCRISPSHKSVELFAAGGIPAVWRAVGAAL